MPHMIVIQTNTNTFDLDNKWHKQINPSLILQIISYIYATKDSSKFI
jgi:hypothetical protein